jgi:hypothetical protein
MRGLLRSGELNETSRAMPRCQASEDWVSRVRKCNIDEELITADRPANTTNNLINSL